jgi:hypothetical protein
LKDKEALAEPLSSHQALANIAALAQMDDQVSTAFLDNQFLYCFMPLNCKLETRDK